MVRARLHGARLGELEFVHGAANAAAQSDACPFRQLRQVARLGAKSTIEFFARIRAPEKKFGHGAAPLVAAGNYCGAARPSLRLIKGMRDAAAASAKAQMPYGECALRSPPATLPVLGSTRWAPPQTVQVSD